MPKPTPARTPAELHEKLGRMVPPALRQSIDTMIEEVATERWAEQMRRVLDAADRVAGPNWRSFRAADLDAASQKALANGAATLSIGRGYRPGAQERAWVLHPERARLFLSGPLGPDAHPTLKAMLVDERGRPTVGWGWAVGTAARVGPSQRP